MATTSLLAKGLFLLEGSKSEEKKAIRNAPKQCEPRIK